MDLNHSPAPYQSAALPNELVAYVKELVEPAGIEPTPMIPSEWITSDHPL